MSRRPSFLSSLRREARACLHVLLLLLLVPIVHPLAEARANQAGLTGVICSSFGAVTAPNPNPIIPAADDAPCCLASMASMPMLAPAEPAELIAPMVPAGRVTRSDITSPVLASPSPRPPARAPPFPA